jgi:hypothetical protein
MYDLYDLGLVISFHWVALTIAGIYTIVKMVKRAEYTAFDYVVMNTIMVCHAIVTLVYFMS